LESSAVEKPAYCRMVQGWLVYMVAVGAALRDERRDAKEQFLALRMGPPGGRPQ
jgi:hypothetical protein